MLKRPLSSTSPPTQVIHTTPHHTTPDFRFGSTRSFQTYHLATLLLYLLALRYPKALITAHQENETSPPRSPGVGSIAITEAVVTKRYYCSSDLFVINNQSN